MNRTKTTKFRRQHYQAIADVISQSNSVDEVIGRLSELFANDNWQFDELKFRDACKPKESEEEELQAQEAERAHRAIERIWGGDANVTNPKNDAVEIEPDNKLRAIIEQEQKKALPWYEQCRE
jgi:hypothetical protein